jgi:hypothetical protein
MRIRSTKPEFWRSRRVAGVSWDARLVLKGLESYVDDNGVGKDDLALIVGDIFQRDLVANPRDTLARVSEAISELHEAGLLHRYEDEGTDLLYIAFWESIQRIDKPGKGRFRRPDGTLAYGESQIRESVASPRVSVAPGTGEQGNRGTGEQGTLAPAPPSQRVALVVASESEPTSQTLVAEWIDHCAEKPPSRVIGHIAKETKAMLDDGIAYERVRAGLAEWNARGLHPSTLPSIVHELANRRPTSSRRQAETDGLFERALTRAQEGDR